MQWDIWSNLSYRWKIWSEIVKFEVATHCLLKTAPTPTASYCWIRVVDNEHPQLMTTYTHSHYVSQVSMHLRFHHVHCTQDVYLVYGNTATQTWDTYCCDCICFCVASVNKWSEANNDRDSVHNFPIFLLAYQLSLYIMYNYICLSAHWARLPTIVLA